MRYWIRLCLGIFCSVTLFLNGLVITFYRDLNNIGWDGGLNFSGYSLIALMFYLSSPIVLASSIINPESLTYKTKNTSEVKK